MPQEADQLRVAVCGEPQCPSRPFTDPFRVYPTPWSPQSLTPLAHPSQAFSNAFGPSSFFLSAVVDPLSEDRRIPLKPFQCLRGPSSVLGTCRELAPLTHRDRWLFRPNHLGLDLGPQSGSLGPFPVPALRTGVRVPEMELDSSLGIMRLAHGSTGFGTLAWGRTELWPLPGSPPRYAPSTSEAGLDPGCRQALAVWGNPSTTPSSSHGPFTFACDASGVSGPFAGVSGFRHSCP